ncbi:MAG TPA: Clp protease N-terminal domain-containing protein [Burkholderiales bacterium]|jgi:ATP-dependent Clp protease ATP-binding subunit ClpA|nr:Clp protease N-terminal domain-containing protein [Burkholderiales bacterium]
MFERYTEKARRVIFFARYEASTFGSPAIDTEHLLLGLVREHGSFQQMINVPLAAIRTEIEKHHPVRAKTPTNVDLPFSEAARRALESAAHEADQFGHRHIGTEHLLLGLLLEERGLAQTILTKLGVQAGAVRAGLKGSRGGAVDYPIRSFVWDSVSGKATPDLEFMQVVSNALEEAGLLGGTAATPEHLLLGILRNDTSKAAKLLQEHGFDLAALREKLRQK